MALLQASRICLAYGNRDLLDSVSLQIDGKTRAALAGVNGCGKSTLMKILAGEIQPDSGTVSKSEGTIAAYLPQTGVSFGSKTPAEEAESAFERFRLLEDEKTRLAAQMNGHDAGWEEKAHRIHEIEEIRDSSCLRLPPPTRPHRPGAERSRIQSRRSRETFFFIFRRLADAYCIGAYPADAAANSPFG